MIDDKSSNSIFVSKKVRYTSVKKNLKNNDHHVQGIEGLHLQKLENIDKTQKDNEKLQRKKENLEAILSKTPPTNFHKINDLKDKIEEITLQINKNNIKDDEAKYFFIDDAINILPKYFDENITHEAEDKIFDDYVSNIVGLGTEAKESDEDICANCNEKNSIHISDGRYVCVKCGMCDTVINDMEKTNFKDSFYENKSNGYMRINHFSELLNQFQAKESTEIPSDIMDAIKVEIGKMGIKKKTDITNSIMRKILKKLNHNSYFEHIPFIINKITNIPPPSITHEEETKLKSMFRQIQEPFEKYKPNGKRNILNYNYIFYKFFELLGKDDLLKYFPLLRHNNKNREHDEVWKKICRELNWEFVPSI